MADIRYSIEVLHPPGLPLTRRQLAVGRFVLGRSSSCDLPLEARGVSREHVALQVLEDGGICLSDLGSTNGSLLDGKRFHERAISGDFVLELGEVRLRFREHEPELGALAFRTGPQMAPTKEAMASANDDEPQTQVDSQFRRLRESLSSFLIINPTQAPLSALLGAALPALGARALCLRDAAGRVLAAAGESGMTLRDWIKTEALSLAMDAECQPSAATERALRQLLNWWSVETGQIQAKPEATPVFPGVASEHSPLKTSLRALARVAKTRVGVLILGESGTGKELVARWVHACSARAAGPFIAINCAALPRDLLEAELFGIEKGAATGVDARPGVFERAHGGTLFLDELGDMPPETQVRLLRAVEDGRIHRVGGKRLMEVDVRLVAATHADLQQAIESKQFRLDLFHRVAGFEVLLPPLRERVADIAPLAFHFFAAALQQNGTRSPGMTEAALRCLQHWHWPGNVRELRQAIEGATATLLDGEALDAQHLPPRIARRTEPSAASSNHSSESAVLSLAEAVARAERLALERALHAAGDVPELAWGLLGIGKTTFYKKLKEHRIQREHDDSDGMEASP
ncbi:sigma 54-interacting transcriptional regulator [Pseudomarimonas arenosa]|uniref:Sigma 54-interacting transcriptional regulator n=1 Tax=Pseudomarimonas arenosa TaxID=2774145 RepID=A0AAW3ZNG1_9GAMM|nr:sigma 54-interacting transcriptional regulator [Pseudomarimonas arenosa]MBD8526465.1 sigma 54-interacting transcriptional regulator [Pseudomarimonas arenosa]